MGCSRHEPVDRSKAVRELLRGRDLANRLRDLLKCDVAGALPQDLLLQIFNSFANTLSMLNSDHVSQLSDNSAADTSNTTSTPSKRRKVDDTYSKVTPNLIDDGYAWRKYGQKDILHNEFPRNYFRCSHKYDGAGCKARKQVQQMSKNPAMFRITYQNHHTCKSFLEPPQIIFHPTSIDVHSSKSKMLCFQNNNDGSHFSADSCTTSDDVCNFNFNFNHYPFTHDHD